MVIFQQQQSQGACKIQFRHILRIMDTMTLMLLFWMLFNWERNHRCWNIAQRLQICNAHVQKGFLHWSLLPNSWLITLQRGQKGVVFLSFVNFFLWYTNSVQKELSKLANSPLQANYTLKDIKSCWNTWLHYEGNEVRGSNSMVYAWQLWCKAWELDQTVDANLFCKNLIFL